jgi:hypothetical protein
VSNVVGLTSTGGRVLKTHRTFQSSRWSGKYQSAADEAVNFDARRPAPLADAEESTYTFCAALKDFQVGDETSGAVQMAAAAFRAEIRRTAGSGRRVGGRKKKKAVRTVAYRHLEIQVRDGISAAHRGR